MHVKCIGLMNPAVWESCGWSSELIMCILPERLLRHESSGSVPGAMPLNCSISSPSAWCMWVTVDFSMMMMNTAWLRLDSSFILVVPVALRIAPLSSRPYTYSDAFSSVVIDANDKDHMLRLFILVVPVALCMAPLSSRPQTCIVQILIPRRLGPGHDSPRLAHPRFLSHGLSFMRPANSLLQICLLCLRSCSCYACAAQYAWHVFVL